MRKLLMILCLCVSLFGCSAGKAASSVSDRRGTITDQESISGKETDPLMEEEKTESTITENTSLQSEPEENHVIVEIPQENISSQPEDSTSVIDPPVIAETPLVVRNASVSIDCVTILDHLDTLDEQWKVIIPDDGVILSQVTYELKEQESAYDLLLRICTDRYIPVSSSFGYVQAIGAIPEKLFDGNGGWLYLVNGMLVPYGSNQYVVEDGDVIRWCYTCRNGDVG